MEREESALDAESDCQDPKSHGDGHHVLTVRDEFCNFLLHGNHKKIACHIVEQDDAQKEKPRAEQIHYHISHRGQRCSSYLTYYQDSAARQCQDLKKNISCEDIVRPDHRHQGCCHKIYKRVVEVDLALIYIYIDIFAAAYD